MDGILGLLGIGGTRSKNSVESLTEIAVNVTQKTVNECSSSIQNVQNIEVDWVAGDVDLSGLNLTQNASINMECLMTASKQNEIQNEIANALAQHAAAQSEGALQSLGGTQADAAALIKNKFQSSVKQEDVQRSTSMITQEQNVRFGTVGGNFIMQGATLDQSAEIVSRALMESEGYNKVITEVASDLQQVTDAESTGLDAVIGETVENIAKTLGISTVGAFAIIPVVIGIVVIMIVIVVMTPFILFSKKSKRSENLQPPFPMYGPGYGYGYSPPPTMGGSETDDLPSNDISEDIEHNSEDDSGDENKHNNHRKSNDVDVDADDNTDVDNGEVTTNED